MNIHFHFACLHDIIYEEIERLVIELSIYIPEADSIYFPKTKEYFQEVISSYSIKNYRSALVMLYSVTVCDLLYKLQEMKDLYDDAVAKSILEEVENFRTHPEQFNMRKSQWEKELIDKIYNQTNLIDDITYTQINHLFEYRNFSAHPALNMNYELISQNQETVIACIKNVLQSILTKPPILVSNVVLTVAKDLADRKDIFVDNNSLNKYLHSKYLSKLDEKSKLRLFKEFWKFCFMLSEDEDCADNRGILRRTLEILTQDIESLLPSYLNENQNAFNVAHDEVCVKHLIIYLSSCPIVYTYLNNTIKLEIDSLLENCPNYLLISWFKYSSFSQHVSAFSSSKTYDYDIIASFLNRLYSYCCLQGNADSLLEAFIKFYGDSPRYKETRFRFESFIEPYLDAFQKHHLEKLIKVSNDNDQIYEYDYIKSCNNKVIKQCKDLIDDSIDFSEFSNFKFDSSILDNNKSGDDEESYFELDDDDLPF